MSKLVLSTGKGEIVVLHAVRVQQIAPHSRVHFLRFALGTPHREATQQASK
jgi:hypothetical protein